MKKIVLATISLTMLATPLAAGTPSADVAQHERNRYGLDSSTPAIQVPVSTSEFVLPAASVSHSSGLTTLTDPAGPYILAPRQTPRDRYGPIHR